MNNKIKFITGGIGLLFFLLVASPVAAAGSCSYSVSTYAANGEPSLKFTVTGPVPQDPSPIVLGIQASGHIWFDTSLPDVACKSGQTCSVNLPFSVLRQAYITEFHSADPSTKTFQYSIGLSESESLLCLDDVPLNTIVPHLETPSTTKKCGEGFASDESAVCPASCPGVSYVDGLGTCCGAVSSDGICQVAQTQPPVVPPPGSNDNGLPTNTLSAQTLDDLNPIKLYSTSASDFLTPGTILSRVLLFAFPIAGLILFVMLIWAGFEILSGAADKKSLDAGKNRATAAIIGFLLLFASYMITQVIQIIFGIKIL